VSRRPKLGYRWHLRRLMAERGMFQTSALAPLLAERGITLSSVQVYRLVTQTPERLNLKTLVALCDIFGCTPTDLIEPVAEPAKRRKAAGKAAGEPDRTPAPKNVTPRRARIVRDDQ
jgi:DNA-binding Xre family transcriptional regulator